MNEITKQQLLNDKSRLEKEKLQLFQNAEFGTVRALEINDEPWFVGKDVAKILGYKETANMRKLLDVTDYKEIDPQSIEFTGFVQNGMTLEPNKNIRRMLLINESGLYQAIFGSKLPTAKQFKHWVTSEVLPTIRKHGAYMTENTIQKALTNPDFLIQLATQLKEEQEARRVAEQMIEEQKPKALFADAVATANTSILIGDLAKLLKQNGIDMGQKRLFVWLRENGYLIKREGADRNSPTQRSMEQGLFEIKETAITHSDGHVTINKTTKVTGKGQIYFINKFLHTTEE